MERAWLFDTLSVSVTEVDFHDPDLRDDPSARERGVRVEIRPVTPTLQGTVYASPASTLHPAICRIDLLESGPGAADRVHWHPGMRGGEPGDRTFDPALSADPIGWLTDQLSKLDGLLLGADAAVARHRADAAAVSSMADEIADAVRTGLAACRRPWPEVRHDDRGMAVPGSG